MKVNFHKVEFETIDGKKVPKDIHHTLGEQLYNESRSVEGSELGRAIYYSKKDEPMTLTIEQAAIVTQWVKQWSHVACKAVTDMINAAAEPQ